MPSQVPVGGNRAFIGAANFRTRVPPDMAKLIRILVAEDHLMNQQEMLRMLARLGYRADAVNNGAEAVAALHRSPYDIVLMDCQMPELDGYEATRRIKANADLRHIPIIVITSYALSGDDAKAMAAGADAYVSKPFSPRGLLATIRKFLPE